MAVNPGPNFFTLPKNNKDGGVTVDFVNESVINPLEVSIDKVTKLLALRSSENVLLAYELLVATRDAAKEVLGQTVVPPAAAPSDNEPENPGHSIS